MDAEGAEGTGAINNISDSVGLITYPHAEAALEGIAGRGEFDFGVVGRHL